MKIVDRAIMKIVDRAIVKFFDMLHKLSLFVDARERIVLVEAREKIIAKRLGLHKRYLEDKERRALSLFQKKKICNIDEACSLLYNEAHARTGEQNPVILEWKYTDNPNFKIRIEWTGFQPDCKS